MIRAGLLTALLVIAGGASAQDRILSVGGSVTEILVALGLKERIVARDTTSTWPESVLDLPDVGYIRRLSPEGVLSVGPDVIIAEHDAGPPETVDILEATEIPFVTVPQALDADGIARKIRAVGEAAGVDGAPLAGDVLRRLRAAQDMAAQQAGERPRKVMFILSLQGGRIMAAGQDTAADAILRMAGARNAVEGVTGYKQLSDEAVTAAAPDAIVMMDRGGDHGASDAALLAMPAIVSTPVAETGDIIRMDGSYLLGFGPRTADAILDLSRALHDE